MANESAYSSDRALRTLFWGLGLLGTAVTWGRTVADGTLAHLLEALESSNGKYVLPGSDSALLSHFTGIWPLDYLLRTLVVFFWEAVDGSHPATTATGIYFAGQLFPIIAAIYLDGLRSGNGSSTLKPSLWFLVFGAAAIGCSGAAWGLAYTAASPLASSSIPLDGLQRISLVSAPRAAVLLIPAIILGYVVPVILMGLPSPALVSNGFQQGAIVIWNTFPLLMFTIVTAGERCLDAVIPSSSSGAFASKRRLHLLAVRWVGAISIAVGFAMHVAVAAVSASAALFPPLFNAKYVRELPPLSLAIPPLSLAKGKTVGDGIHSFMLWDQGVGYTLVLLVFLVQLRNVLRFSEVSGRFGWTSIGAFSFLLSFLVGPGTTLMAASWLRDEILFDLVPGKSDALKKGAAG